MNFFLDLYNGTKALQKKEFDELMSLNEKAKQHNIILTEEKVQYIIDSRKSALSDMGRIEFGESTAKKLLDKFCESAYVSKHNVHRIIGELLEIFYYTKNETDDKVSDKVLIEYLYNAFNGECGGSITLLYDWAVNSLIHKIRFEGLAEPVEEKDDEEEDADEQLS